MPASQQHLVYIVTHPITLRYKLADQIAYLCQSGYRIDVITSDAPELEQIKLPADVKVHTVRLQREISLLDDFQALWQTYWIVRKLRPQIVNASTPKAGMIGMIAAWANRVPVRIYTLRGLRHETLQGKKARLLRALERLTAACSTRVISVSESLKQAYLSDRITKPEKVIVLGDGSSNGVDVDRFDAGDSSQVLRTAVYEELGIPATAPVVAFIGRFTKDKGFVELTDAFDLVRQDVPDCRLLLVGEFEPGDPVPVECRERLEANPNVIVVPFVSDPARYYAATDILAFPSYREGLPVVPLEAAAAGVPTVAFRATGNVDAVRHGKTGIIVPLHDTKAFADAIRIYLHNPELRRTHGQAAKSWVRRSFRPQHVWELLHAAYQAELARL